MWRELTRVSYDLQTGVIIRQPTINVKKVSDFQRSVSLSVNQHQPFKMSFTFSKCHYIPAERRGEYTAGFMWVCPPLHPSSRVHKRDAQCLKPSRRTRRMTGRRAAKTALGEKKKTGTPTKRPQNDLISFRLFSFLSASEISSPVLVSPPCCEEGSGEEWSVFLLFRARCAICADHSLPPLGTHSALIGCGASPCHTNHNLHQRWTCSPRFWAHSRPRCRLCPLQEPF